MRGFFLSSCNRFLLALVAFSQFELGCRETESSESNVFMACPTINDVSNGGQCPGDMVLVQDSFCMDRYEASRPDATMDSMGNNISNACSVKGVIPWHTDSMSVRELEKFELACDAANKRLCTRGEWFIGCTGPNGTQYVFGNSFDPEICNSVDTLCDDYCEDHGISDSACYTEPNCGYHCGTSSSSDVWCFEIAPTGSFESCTNEYGTMDINGNVWEAVRTAAGNSYEARGGAFNCADAEVRFDCSFDSIWDGQETGFRCCKDAS